jgi:hypothetical protein
MYSKQCAFYEYKQKVIMGIRKKILHCHEKRKQTKIFKKQTKSKNTVNEIQQTPSINTK